MAYNSKLFPGTNLPRSINNDEQRSMGPPVWDKKLPPGVKPGSVPLYSGGGEVGGGISWYDPSSGNVRNERGMLTDNTMSGLTPDQRAGLASNAANNPNGLMSAQDFQAGTQMYGPSTEIHDRITDNASIARRRSFNYSQFATPDELRASGPDGDSLAFGTHTYGNGKTYNIDAHGKSIEIPPQFIRRTTGPSGNNLQLSVEGKRYVNAMQKMERYNPNPAPKKPFYPANNNAIIPSQSPSTPQSWQPNGPGTPVAMPSSSSTTSPNMASPLPSGMSSTSQSQQSQQPQQGSGFSPSWINFFNGLSQPGANNSLPSLLPPSTMGNTPNPMSSFGDYIRNYFLNNNNNAFGAPAAQDPNYPSSMFM